MRSGEVEVSLVVFCKGVSEDGKDEVFDFWEFIVVVWGVFGFGEFLV